jgi:hypothetical protein
MVVLGFLSSAALATPIYVDSSGREWLDVNDTRYRSWNDTASICNAISGACSGTLAAHDASSLDVDLTGYRWAARNEVRELFYEVAGLPSGSLNTYTALFPFGAGYGGNAFGIFEPTLQLGAGPGVLNVLNGVTRDRFFNADLNLWGAYSGLILSPPFGADAFTLNAGLPTNTREISMGMYLYREVPVPEPGTMALFAAAFVAMFALRRKPREGLGFSRT